MATTDNFLSVVALFTRFLPQYMRIPLLYPFYIVFSSYIVIFYLFWYWFFNSQSGYYEFLGFLHWTYQIQMSTRHGTCSMIGGKFKCPLADDSPHHQSSCAFAQYMILVILYILFNPVMKLLPAVTDLGVRMDIFMTHEMHFPFRYFIIQIK